MTQRSKAFAPSEKRSRRLLLIRVEGGTCVGAPMSCPWVEGGLAKAVCRSLSLEA